MIKPMNNQWISMIWILYFPLLKIFQSQLSLAVTVLVNRGLKSSTTLRILHFWAWFPFSKLPISTLGSKHTEYWAENGMENGIPNFEPRKNCVDFKKWKVKLERSNWNWKEWSWKDRAFRSVNQKLLNFRFSNLILSNSTIFPTKLSN